MQAPPGAGAPLNCPHSGLNAPGSPGGRDVPTIDPGLEAYWQQILSSVVFGAAAVERGDYLAARSVLADVLLSSTMNLASDPLVGFGCSLGVAAAYRALALAFVADSRLVRGSWAFRRAHQIALRFQHLALVWVTHVWEKFARREAPGGMGMSHYDQEYIDGSAWPISLRDINVEMTVVQNTLEDVGSPKGHRARWPEVPHDFRDPGLKVGIVSLCAYPPEHVLPRYAASNHQIYASRHGYRYHVGREILEPGRPPAWGKIKLMYQALEQPDVDWWLWFDCDTYFMNMSITLDSLLYKYGRAQTSQQDAGPGLEADFNMLVAEDHAMLNTGAFFLRSSAWSQELLRKVWGPDDSIWTNHPWWENAAILWNFLKDNSEKFRSEDHDVAYEHSADEMEGIYPVEVRLAPQSEFNSYHPATSQFLHDTWEQGKFALAFNGVLSNTSPEVIRVLYGNYYELACQLNAVSDQCVEVEAALPWLAGKPLSRNV